ncbi:NAD(P)-binding protein [Clathrospora elynae]|uniref:NAD(P)-binding protein n=1 Tax=Clathrospora elynae TaxID=706981 RepID=A0A6A5S7V0_9PLEO|nr:NAD(P)-binding protein [Clathrospora elynae]
MTNIITVVGVTGNQGSSVARVFLNEPGWKFRGINRDKSKSSAANDLDDSKSLKKAFQDASSRLPNDVAYDREVAQAKAIVDAAAANVETLDRFLLSSLSDTRKWSKGTIKWNMYFDAKAEAANYLNATYPRLWEKTSLLHMGYYANDSTTVTGTQKKQDDGSFAVTLPMSGDRKILMTDAAADTGHFTKALVELPPGNLLSGTGSGVKCVFEQMRRKAMEDAMGPIYGLELDWSDPNIVFPWDLDIDVKYTPMEEYMKTHDWSCSPGHARQAYMRGLRWILRT